MELTFYNGAEAVACDQLLEAGYKLEIFDDISAKRLWVLSIRGKVKGIWVRPYEGEEPTHQADWIISKGAGSMSAWVRNHKTEVLFGQLGHELGLDDVPPLGPEPLLGFRGARAHTVLWSDLQGGADYMLGPPGPWGLAREQLLRASEELTQEELSADPNGQPPTGYGFRFRP